MLIHPTKWGYRNDKNKNKMKKPIFTLEQELSKLSVAALRCKREILRGIENSALGRLIKRFIDWMEKTLNK